MSKNKPIFYSEKLKKLRIASHLPQIVLADKLNISRSCLANYEAGKRTPDREMLASIAKFFNISPEYFSSNTEAYLTDIKEHLNSTKLMKEISASGKLDISGISPMSKAMLIEFYNYLEEKNTQAE